MTSASSRNKTIALADTEMQALEDRLLIARSQLTPAEVTDKTILGDALEVNRRYACLAEKRLDIAKHDKRIQGYANGVFMERNFRSSARKTVAKKKRGRQLKGDRRDTRRQFHRECQHPHESLGRTQFKRRNAVARLEAKPANFVSKQSKSA